ncbi:hypothetical protein GALMADRAFT_247719 [Galerina marginata CBS 339.88]|uniref:Uncharacterized protein n=1 Tax=Galerina marginata (strain CBS 339.88) TaxID=685588 RepID=A0A067SZG0_GALM3|nr:hypothetical protein GALMADRAFT_247719 [Galerina marginata CBS 339.88]
MKYFTTISAFVSVIPGILSLTINTPTSVVQCQPQMLTWADGTAPYYITIIPAGQPGAAPIKSFDTQTGKSLTFTVDIKGGTQVGFALKDSTGATAYTDSVTIQPSTDASCMGPPQSNVAAASSPANPPAPAAAPAASSSGAAPAPAPAGTMSGALAVTSSTGVPATRAVTTTVAAQTTASASRSSTTGPGASATPGTTASGAQSRYAIGGTVFAAAFGLLGAVFL